MLEPAHIKATQDADLATCQELDQQEDSSSYHTWQTVRTTIENEW